jgi:methyl-accepting chemotaxis protein
MFSSLRNKEVSRALALAAAIDISQAVIEFKLDGTIVTANQGR